MNTEKPQEKGMEAYIQHGDVFSRLDKEKPSLSIINYEFYRKLTKNQHYAEKQNADMSLIFIDLDIYMRENKPMTEEHIVELCNIIYKNITDISPVSNTDKLWFAVLRKLKDHSLPKKPNGFYKEGIHIIISILVNREFKRYLINKMKAPISDFITKHYPVPDVMKKDILDNNSAHVPVFIIGQSKPDKPDEKSEPHKLHNVYVMKKDKLRIDHDFTEDDELCLSAEFSVLPWNFRKHVKPTDTTLNYDSQQQVKLLEKTKAKEKQEKKEFYEDRMSLMVREIKRSEPNKKIMLEILNIIIDGLDDTTASTRKSGGCWTFVLQAIKHICESCHISKEEQINLVTKFSEKDLSSYVSSEDVEQRYDALEPLYDLESLTKLLEEQNKQANLQVKRLLMKFDYVKSNVNHKLAQLQMKWNNCLISDEEKKNLVSSIVKIMNQKYCYLSDLTTPTVISYTENENNKGFTTRNYCFQKCVKLDEIFMKYTISCKMMKGKEEKYISLNPGEIWKYSTKRQQVSRSVFEPTRNISDTYNLYHGLAIPHELVANVEPLEESHPFFKHIFKRWCNNKRSQYEYVLNTFAFMIQKPGQKTKVALVLKGPEGVGKGVIVQIIMSIIGEDYCLKTGNPSDIIGQFNAPLCGKLFVFLDEMTWGGSKEQSGILKKLITEDTVQINKKGIDSITYSNYINCIIASNENWVIPAGVGCRRWVVLDVDNEFAGSKSNLSKSQKEELNQIVNIPLDRIAKFFHDRDISKFDPTELEITDGLRDQQITGLSKLDKWWFEIIESGAKVRDTIDLQLEGPESRRTIVKEDFFNLYKQQARDEHSTNVQFWKSIKKMVTFTEHRPKGGKRMVVFPEIVEARNGWRSYMRDSNWKFDGEENNESEELNMDNMHEPGAQIDNYDDPDINYMLEGLLD